MNPAAIREGQVRQGLHRSARPERRQHAEGPGLYGIKADAYTGRAADVRPHPRHAHAIVTSPAFNGDRILGAILFEQTMDRDVEGRGSADYLWSVKNVVPS
jgi:fructose-bisphosphate aldolase class I